MTNQHGIIVSIFLAVVALSDGRTHGQGRTQRVDEPPSPYRAIDNHFKLAEGRWWESASAVDIDIDGRSIWVAERCAADSCAGSKLNPILKFDESGVLVQRFGEALFILPHGIHVDREGNVWVTDARAANHQELAQFPGEKNKGHVVYKFSPEGRVLLTIGRPGVAGDGTGALLNGPCDVVTASNGDVLVAEGHGRQEPGATPNVARIVKFTRDGKFLRSWGRPGSGHGEFKNPHGLALDSRGRLFVADRGNNRIQIFDQSGTFLAEWRQFGRPSGLFIDNGDMLYVADSESSEATNPGWKRGIRIGTATDGQVGYFIPEQSADPGQGGRSGAEGVAADARGNVYGAEVRGGALALKKYVRQ